MLRPVLFSCLTALATASISLSAQQMEDVVRLRGGGAVRGTIIEQIPGESLKIQASDGEVFIYTMDEIVEISREPAGEGGGQAGVARGDPASEGEAGPLPSATPALAPTGPVCVIGEHSGFPEADARTAALLVCGELRKQGVPVGEPVYRAPEGADRYRLGLHRLGQKILVRLSHVDPGGQVTIERQIQLAGIEEMISGAPRLVQALVQRESLESTVDMESVVEEEARVHRKIPGESFWELGIVGTFALIEGADLTRPGYRLGWFYETTSYSVETQFWGAGGEDDDGDSHSFVCWGIGGRYFFNKQNFSSYAGGGITHAWAGYEQPTRTWNSRWERWEEDRESEDGNGLGVYAVGGIEALRLTKVRLRLELRVDRPLFRLPNRDVMPVTLGVSLAWG